MAKKKNNKIEVPVAEARNFVAKHAREFCVAATHIDRKKQDKKGQTRKAKHKGKRYDGGCHV